MMDRTSRAVSGKLQRGEGSGDSRRPRATCPVCPGAGSSCDKESDMTKHAQKEITTVA